MTPPPEPDDDALLDGLERAAFGYFLDAVESDCNGGMVADNSRPARRSASPSSGSRCPCYPVAVERGWMARAEALARSLAALRFFRDSDQSGGAEATGYKGFYYHFLDRYTGARVWRSELSMIDTALLIAGALMAAACTSRRTTPTKSELREARRPAVPAHRLALGAERRRDDQAGLEARMRIPALRLGGLQRGDRPLRARAGLADASARGRRLPRVDGDLPVGESLRLRFPLRRPAVRAPVLARVDRLSRHPRSLHAREALRLFREQPPRDATCSASTRGATRTNSPATTSTAGASPPATGRATTMPALRTDRAPLCRLRGARRAVRTRRRDARGLGARRVAAVRAGDCDAGGARHARPLSGDDRRRKLREQLQSEPRRRRHGVGFGRALSGSTRASS